MDDDDEETITGSVTSSGCENDDNSSRRTCYFWISGLRKGDYKVAMTGACAYMGGSTCASFSGLGFEIEFTSAAMAGTYIARYSQVLVPLISPGRGFARKLCKNAAKLRKSRYFLPQNVCNF